MTESIFFKIPHIVTECFVTLPRHERVGKGSFGSRRFRSLVAKLLQAITTPLLYHTLQCFMNYVKLKVVTILKLSHYFVTLAKLLQAITTPSLYYTMYY